MGAWGFVLGLIAGFVLAFASFLMIGVNDLKQKRYMVSVDHPTFARQDKIVTGVELESFIHELKLAGFENIKYEEIKEKEWR